MTFSMISGAIVPDDKHVQFRQEEPRPDRDMLSLPKRAMIAAPVPIVHQGTLPICTGVAAATARTILHYQQQNRIVPFSGLFIYKWNRVYDGLSEETCGSTLAASMQTLQHKGVCRESLYRSSRKNLLCQFPQNCALLMQDAFAHRVAQYARCDTLEHLLVQLADQHPVAFSMVIHTDFYKAVHGVVSEQRKGLRIGGHSMVAVGYDMPRQLVHVVQSWGSAANGPTDKGYMHIPFSWFKLIDEATGSPQMFEAFALLR